MNILDVYGYFNPIFCYHPSLSISGNCRMCLIEVANRPKPIVACTAIYDTLTFLNPISSYTKKAQEQVMEFLLINHPLDCPICDQGGECDLQDNSLRVGTTKSRFFFKKRGVNDIYISPIVSTVFTRCIHCTRCIRFLSEIENISFLGFLNRSNHSHISSYRHVAVCPDVATKVATSGTLAHVCPVGRLKTRFLSLGFGFRFFSSSNSNSSSSSKKSVFKKIIYYISYFFTSLWDLIKNILYYIFIYPFVYMHKSIVRSEFWEFVILFHEMMEYVLAFRHFWFSAIITYFVIIGFHAWKIFKIKLSKGIFCPWPLMYIIEGSKEAHMNLKMICGWIINICYNILAFFINQLYNFLHFVAYSFKFLGFYFFGENNELINLFYKNSCFYIESFINYIKFFPNYGFIFFGILLFIYTIYVDFKLFSRKNK